MTTSGFLARLRPAGLSSTALGILLMLLGMFLFSLNDAIGKWLVATYSVGQVLLIRSLAALAVLGPVLCRFGLARLVSVERPRMQAARVAFSTGEVVCFYWAVTYLPLADVMTFWMAAPICVAAAAPLVLGERVGLWRWGAIGAGFLGVLIALEPFSAGQDRGGAVLVALLGMACFAAMILTGRQLRGTPDTTLVFWQICGALVAGLLLSPWDWTGPTALDFALLGLLGVVAMLAHVCVNRALKLAPAAHVAPFQYTLLPWAVVLGWLFFGDLPRLGMFLGALIIVGAGLVIFLRENAGEPRPADPQGA
jgi:drug/metabolite transporter (DMT)-like permease